MTKLILIVLSILISTTGCSGRNPGNKDKFGETTNQSNLTGGATTASSKYREAQYEFMGHSSQGGAIFAYYDKDVLKYFEIDLLGERGKATYRFDLIDPSQVLILCTGYEYEESIYEGESQVVS